jgi:adenosylhomocysteine nucleosidase
MSTRIGILAPMPNELRPVVRTLGLHRDGELGGLPRHTGSRAGVALVATRTGIGLALAAEATTRLLDAESPDLVIVSGIAGGIPGASEVGDLVVPETVVDGATGERFGAAALPGVTGAGAIRTGDVDSYRLTPAELGELCADGFVALDMETAAVARVCAERDVPWLAFRGISDMAGDTSVGEEVMTMVHADGSPDVGAALRFLVRHPRRIPRMVRLGREAGAAAAMAARATSQAVDALAG